MRGKFGLKLPNSLKLPRIHARFYCNANEKSLPWKGLFVTKSANWSQFQRITPTGQEFGSENKLDSDS